MLINELEAMEKRCHAPIGTMHDERVQNYCIGSRCMAWRWGRVDTPTPNENMPGYCGLAGKPWNVLGEPPVPSRQG